MTKKEKKRPIRRVYRYKDDKLIRKLFAEGKTDADIAVVTGRTAGAITKRRCVIGAVRHKKGRGVAPRALEQAQPPLEEDIRVTANDKKIILKNNKSQVAGLVIATLIMAFITLALISLSIIVKLYQ